jgi:hypothetical protein
MAFSLREHSVAPYYTHRLAFRVPLGILPRFIYCVRKVFMSVKIKYNDKISADSCQELKKLYPNPELPLRASNPPGRERVEGGAGNAWA